MPSTGGALARRAGAEKRIPSTPSLGGSPQRAAGTLVGEAVEPEVGELGGRGIARGRIEPASW